MMHAEDEHEGFTVDLVTRPTGGPHMTRLINCSQQPNEARCRFVKHHGFLLTALSVNLVTNCRLRTTKPRLVRRDVVIAHVRGRPFPRALV